MLCHYCDKFCFLPPCPVKISFQYFLASITNNMAFMVKCYGESRRETAAFRSCPSTRIGEYAFLFREIVYLGLSPARGRFLTAVFQPTPVFTPCLLWDSTPGTTFNGRHRCCPPHLDADDVRQQMRPTSDGRVSFITDTGRAGKTEIKVEEPRVVLGGNSAAHVIRWLFVYIMAGVSQRYRNEGSVTSAKLFEAHSLP